MEESVGWESIQDLKTEKQRLTGVWCLISSMVGKQGLVTSSFLVSKLRVARVRFLRA